MTPSTTIRRDRAEASGYLHRDYAYSLEEFGRPRHLPLSAGWTLTRLIPSTSAHDAIGCYPLFCCRHWDGLADDLAAIDDLVAVSLVTDPFGEHSPDLLHRCFPDVMIPFKEHFVIDLERELTEFVCRHHQRNAKHALESVAIEHCAVPDAYIDEWVELYAQLIRRHGISGIPAFSRQILTRQLRVPGLELFRAVAGGETVGMLQWFVQNQVAYYHLAAYNEIGYRMKASFALFWVACEYFRDRGVRWLNLGAGPGARGGDESGLTRFKRGWSTGTRTAYFCGRIFDRETYATFARQNPPAAGYFPAYRNDEFR
jgi:hypothetical protein